MAITLMLSELILLSTTLLAFYYRPAHHQYHPRPVGPRRNRRKATAGRGFVARPSTTIMSIAAFLLLSTIVLAFTASLTGHNPLVSAESATERWERRRAEKLERRSRGVPSRSVAQRHADREAQKRRLELDKYRTGEWKRDLPSDDMLRIGILHRPSPSNPLTRRCAPQSQRGDRLRVHYNGTLYKDGKVIDCSIEREQPFEFTLGEGEVLKGWDQGLFGMCVKEKRRLTIPSDLAYGEAGAVATGGRIDPGATLVYEVELLRLTRNETKASYHRLS